MTVLKPIASDSAICQNGGVSVTIRTSIVIGAKKGNIEAQNASDEFGLRAIGNVRQNPVTSSKAIGSANCPPSCMLVTIEPTSA